MVVWKTISNIFRYLYNYFHIPSLEVTKLYDKPDSIKAYLENHLEPIIENFKQKATIHYRLYTLTQIFILLVSSLIPIVNVIGVGKNHSNEVMILSAILGSAVVVATGILQLNKSYENYILFKSATGNIQREYQYFINSINEYYGKSAEEKNRIFISSIEIIISNTITEYYSQQRVYNAAQKDSPVKNENNSSD